MFGSPMIDVAIGLIFFYFLFSMITSHINEFIAAKMEWRANDLEAQIRRMLGDPNLANKVLHSPVVTSIAGESGKLSYIPPNTFALALFDAFVPEGQNANVFDHVRAGVVSDMSTNPASKTILNIVDHANGDMTKARAGAETWFNAAMDRVSGSYKRRMQKVTFVVSLLLTVIVGADTIAITDALYKEPSLRAAITGAAQAAQTSAQVQAAQTSPSGSASSLTQSIDLIEKNQFPLGWGAFPADLVGALQANPVALIKKILGLLITTLAISLGAPFWFNLLKDIGNLRSSGPKPDSPASASEKAATSASANLTTLLASAPPAAIASSAAVSAATNAALSPQPPASYSGGI
ncbi:MAG TPA: hypothetical protein VF429_10905 [Anaerolineae bacterium]